MNIKLSDLTIAGWMLTAVTIGVIVVLMIYSGSLWNDFLPSGQYPAILLAVPGLVIGIFFFALAAFALKAVGLSVVRRTPQPGHSSPEPQGKPIGCRVIHIGSPTGQQTTPVITPRGFATFGRLEMFGR